MGRCYLHIGPHKAASSYLQTSAFRNRDLLASEEISIPQLGENGAARPHHNLGHELTGHWKFRKEAGTFDDLKRYLVSNEPRNILISSEVFEGVSRKEENFQFLKEFFASLSYEVRVLMVVRPQTGLINSGYTEQIKRFRHRKTFPEFVDWALKNPRAKFDMNESFKFWIKNFDCDFIPLNDEVMEQGLDRVFFQRLGLAEEKLGQLQDVEIANTSPGPKTIEAARIIRGILENLFGKKVHKKQLPGGLELRRILIKKSGKAGWNKTKFYGYDSRLFEFVRDRFGESNDRFSQSVFGRPWAEVFHDQRKPSNVYDLDAATRNEKAEMAELVQEVLYSMHKD
jgi:hypothetical protein